MNNSLPERFIVTPDQNDIDTVVYAFNSRKTLLKHQLPKVKNILAQHIKTGNVLATVNKQYHFWSRMQGKNFVLRFMRKDVIPSDWIVKHKFILYPVDRVDWLWYLRQYTKEVLDETIRQERIASKFNWPQELYDRLKDWLVADISYQHIKGDTFEATIIFDMDMTFSE